MMLNIDGSFGEGGGQILRTSLGLSIVTGRPFRIDNIRANRSKPGLLRQHLTAVNAAAAVGHAQVSGASLGSQQLIFIPTELKCADHVFEIGSAGSATLVLQTVLPAMLRMSAGCTVTVEGGTHNPNAPPFDFIEKAFVPLLRKMGADIEVHLHRYGFYPAGGGRISLSVRPTAAFVRLDLRTRGEICDRRARALVANLPHTIAEREIGVVADKMSWPRESLLAHRTRDSNGPGNVVTIELECENVTEVFTGFGEKGVPAEAVAEQAIDDLKEYLVTEGAAGPHLADQLLLPMAVAAGGTFTTGPVTTHTTTNCEVIRKFLDVTIDIEETESRVNTVTVSTSS